MRVCYVHFCITFLIACARVEAARSGQDKTGDSEVTQQPSRSSEMLDSGIVLFVSSNGNDGWSGKKPTFSGNDGPFLTLERARNAIRSVKTSVGLTRPITVFVRAGTYFLEHPFVLEAQDSGSNESPILYTNYPGESPVISGGAKIIWSQKDQNGLWIADNVDWQFRTLRVAEKLQTLARHPNVDPEHIYDGGYFFVANRGDVSTRIVSAQSLPSGWSYKGGEVFAFTADSWNSALYTIASANVGTSELFGDFVSHSDNDASVGQGSRFFLSNIPEALDARGEWYLDKGKKQLRYFPTEGASKTQLAVAPKLNTIVQVAPGSRYISINGFSFMDVQPNATELGNVFGAGTALQINGADHITVSKCKFSLLDGHAILLENGSTENTIDGNEIHHVSAGGIVMIGTNQNTGKNRVSGNKISHVGLVLKESRGIHLHNTHSDVVRGNFVHDVPRGGIQVVASKDALIEYNIVKNTGLETADMGGIYAGGDKNENVTWRFNYVNHVLGRNSDSEGRMQKYSSAHGFYGDMLANSQNIVGNVFAGKMARTIDLHGGNDNIVQGNLIVSTPTDAHFRTLTDLPNSLMTRNVIRSNLVLLATSSTALFRADASSVLWRPRQENIDYNFYWHDGNDLFSNPSVVPFGRFQNWLDFGYDAHGNTDVFSKSYYPDAQREQIRAIPKRLRDYILADISGSPVGEPPLISSETAEGVAEGLCRRYGCSPSKRDLGQGVCSVPSGSGLLKVCVNAAMLSKVNEFYYENLLCSCSFAM